MRAPHQASRSRTPARETAARSVARWPPARNAPARTSRDSGTVALRHRQEADVRAHPVRLGAHRKRQALRAPHLRLVGLLRHWRARPADTADRTAPARAPGSPAPPTTPATATRQSCRCRPAADRPPRRASAPPSARPRAPHRPGRASGWPCANPPSRSRSPARPAALPEQTPIPLRFPTPGGTVCSRACHTHPKPSSPSAPQPRRAFSRDGKTLFHLRGSGLPQVWALDLATGADRQLTFHDEKVAILRRSPVDDRLIYGIDRGGDERQQLLLLDPATRNRAH